MTDTNPPSGVALDEFLDSVRTLLKRQHHAALAMLRESIELCPDGVWYDDTPTNTFWRIAYHTLYFTHLYLQPDEAAFRPWAGEQSNVQHLDGIAGPPDPESNRPLVPEPYSRAEVVAYWKPCDEMLTRPWTHSISGAPRAASIGTRWRSSSTRS